MKYDNEVVDDYRKMVYGIAWTYTNKRPLWEDLCQEGFIGLEKACRTFNKKNGVKFSTWAHIKITGQMRQYLNYNVDIVHVPVTVENKPAMVEIDCLLGEGVEDRSYSDLYDSLSRLDSEMARAIRMHYVEGYTKTEIAVMMDVNYQTLVSRMNRSLERLREIMEE